MGGGEETGFGGGLETIKKGEGEERENKNDISQRIMVRF
jgi:hypothetical protein